MKAPATVLRALRQAATEHSVDADLLAAISKQESNFNPLAVGDIDIGPSLGAGQINLRGAGTSYRSNPSALMDPRENARAAARYLRACAAAFPDDEARIISAYNAGVTGASREDWWSVNGESYVLPVAGYLTTIRREGLQEDWDADVPEPFRSYGKTLLDCCIALKGVCDTLLLPRIREAKALCQAATAKLEGL